MRKTRSDIRVENLEKKLGIKPGSIRHESGRKVRKDKTLGAMRKEAQKDK